MATKVADRVLLDTNVLLVNDLLLHLLEEVECSGKQVHDANIVATMRVHGIDTLVTINTGDFARFQNRVTVVGLPPV